MKLFGGSDGYADGEQRRDFVSVEDVVEVNLQFLERSRALGHLQRAAPAARRRFNDVAVAAVNTWRAHAGRLPRPWTN